MNSKKKIKFISLVVPNDPGPDDPPMEIEEVTDEFVKSDKIGYSEAEKKLKDFLELVIANKALDLMNEGHFSTMDELRLFIYPHTKKPYTSKELLKAYTNITGPVPYTKKINMDTIPDKFENIIKPEGTLSIAKCCATCKHFMPVSTRYLSRGFCLYKRKDIPDRIEYKNDPNYETMNTKLVGNPDEVINKFCKIFPMVHAHTNCEYYTKTTSRTRMRVILPVIKAVQKQIIYDGDE